LRKTCRITRRVTDKLSVRFEHDGDEAVVLLEMTRVRMDPWVRRLVAIVALVDNLPLDQSIARSLSWRSDDDMTFAPDDPSDIIPGGTLGSVFEAGDDAPGSLTDSQIAAAVFDYAFDMQWETPWSDEEDISKLPKTPDEARAQMKTWLGEPVPGEDAFFWEGLEHALAGRWTEMGRTVRMLSGVMAAAASERQAK